MLTQSQLKSQLHYNPETGIFTWLTPKQGRTKKVGSITRGYLLIQIEKNTRIQAHRLAWLYVYGELPSTYIDHINHDPADNRICNLREVTHMENHRNQKISSKNTSGHMGVGFNKALQKWSGTIGVKMKKIHLGYFDTKEEAIYARTEAEKLYGFHDNHGAEVDVTK